MFRKFKEKTKNQNILLIKVITNASETECHEAK